MRAGRQWWSIVGIVLLGGMVIAACADCRCGAAPATEAVVTVDAAPPPAPPQPRLDVKFVAQVTLPGGGHIEELATTEDRGVVVADATSNGLVLRWLDSSLRQRREAPLPSVDVLNISSCQGSLWIAAKFDREIVVDRHRLRPVRDPMDHFSANLLLLEIDSASGEVLRYKQLGGHSSIVTARLACSALGLVVAATFVSRGNGTEVRWGDVDSTMTSDRASLYLSLLELPHLTPVWEMLSDASTQPAPLVVVDQRYALISGAADREVSLGGRTLPVSQQQADWSARLNIETGSVAELVELPRFGFSIGVAAMLHESRPYYAIGGSPSTLDVWSPVTRRFRQVDAMCASVCTAELIWAQHDGVLIAYREELPSNSVHLILTTFEGHHRDETAIPDMADSILALDAHEGGSVIYARFAGRRELRRYSVETVVR